MLCRVLALRITLVVTVLHKTGKEWREMFLLVPTIQSTIPSFLSKPVHPCQSFGFHPLRQHWTFFVNVTLFDFIRMRSDKRREWAKTALHFLVGPELIFMLLAGLVCAHSVDNLLTTSNGFHSASANNLTGGWSRSAQLTTKIGRLFSAGGIDSLLRENISGPNGSGSRVARQNVTDCAATMLQLTTIPPTTALRQLAKTAW